VQTNYNFNAITLLEMLVKFFIKQAMNIKLAVHNQSKYDIVKYISAFLRKRIEFVLFDIIYVYVKIN
jgi:hypothetical protein